MATDTTQKTLKYNCEKCCFYTNNKNDYRRHVSTSKHKISNGLLKKTQSYDCEHCNKSFNDRSGLWRHKKKCNDIPPSNEDPLNEAQTNAATLLENPSLVVELLKQNKEFKDLILEERREFQQIIKYLIGNNKTSNSNNN